MTDPANAVLADVANTDESAPSMPVCLKTKGGKEISNELKGNAFIIVYDTQGHYVLQYTVWNPNEYPQLPVFKAELVNVLEFLGDAYARSALELAGIAENLRKKLNEKQAKFPLQAAHGAAGKVHSRVEIAIDRVASWDGRGEFSAVVPYCSVSYQDKEHQIVDFMHTRPLVNGFLVYSIWERGNRCLKGDWEL